MAELDEGLIGLVASELTHHTDSFMTLTCGTKYLAEHILAKVTPIIEKQKLKELGE